MTKDEAIKEVVYLVKNAKNVDPDDDYVDWAKLTDKIILLINNIEYEPPSCYSLRS